MSIQAGDVDQYLSRSAAFRFALPPASSPAPYDKFGWMQQESPETILTATTDPDSSLSFSQAREIAESHHFVFLCGLHRSGTTLLFRMLREHPEMSGFANNKVATNWTPLEDEGQFLQGIYPPAMCYGGPGSFAFAPEAHLTESSDLLTPDNKAQLAVDWFPYWDLAKRFLLEKSPPHLLMTRFLQSVFPNSSFVIIVRHPVAVSLATTKWSTNSLDSLLEHWLVAHETFQSDRPHLQRVLMVAYESLAEEPAATLRRICAFLGVPPHETSFAATTEHNQGYFAQWREMAENPETGASLREWTARYEARVSAFGYSLQNPALR
jgi:Sulfotransferase family